MWTRFFLFAYTLKDAIALVIGDFPIRLSEFVLYLSSARGFAFKNLKINKIHFFILSILLLNGILVFIGSSSSDVDIPFYTKYLLRNFLMFCFILSVSLVPYQITYKQWFQLAKTIVVVNILFSIPNFFGYNIVFSGFEEYRMNDMFGLPRLRGTASEPAYMIPMLAFPLFIFDKSNEKGSKIYLYLTLLLMALTISSFGFAVIIIYLGLKTYEILDLRYKFTQNRLFVITLFISILLTFFVYFMGKIGTQLYDYTSDKMIGFLQGEATDFSSKARLTNYNACINRFNDGNFKVKLLGYGTGAYYKFIQGDVKGVLEEASEAHNLYLSTLHDRGILGLALLVLIFILIFSIQSLPNTNDTVYQAIRFGILIQFIHWFLTGNVWLYYFWAQVAFLFSITSNKNEDTSNREIL